MFALTQYLLENGHRKIFIINGPQDISSGYERYRGFCKAMQQSGILVDDEYPYQYISDYTRQGGIDGCRKMLEMKDRATALIATNAEVLIGALIYLSKQQIKIPDDISVVSYSLPVNLPLFPIDITSATQNPSILGEKAAGLLLERVRSSKMQNREVIYPCLIHYGNSVRRI